ncbi:hypothetical protein Tco_0868012 [Tanacetum coccineum]
MVISSPCLTDIKNWLVQKQTTFGKDFPNPFTADSLLKTTWFSTHHASHALCYSNEALAIPEQTATGKEISNLFMAGSPTFPLFSTFLIDPFLTASSVSALESIVDTEWRQHKLDWYKPITDDIRLLFEKLLIPVAHNALKNVGIFENALKEEMLEDLKYVKSVEKEVDDLKMELVPTCLINYDLELHEIINLALSLELLCDPLPSCDLVTFGPTCSYFTSS